MKKIKIYQVDSFTKTKLQGNPAGVVPDASNLTEAEMQSIARELNNSETAFILPPEGDDHEVRLRFFTPTTEVPTCGHATVAAHYVRAVENNFSSRIYNHKVKPGVFPIEVEKYGDDYFIFMNQGKPAFQSIIDGADKDELTAALGIMPDDLNPRAPVQIVDTGHSKVMVPVKSRSLLNSLAPDYSRLAQLSKKIECNGYYVFTFDLHSPPGGEPEGDSVKDSDLLIHGRMFAPAIGINEDPVTGNANGPAGAYIVKYMLAEITSSQFTFKAKQGEAMKRPGIITVSVDIENGEPINVKIGGEAVIVFKTELPL